MDSAHGVCARPICHLQGLVHTLTFHGIQFSRAEFVLAAGTFLGDLTPDDSDQPPFLIIHELPRICADSFSTGKAV